MLMSMTGFGRCQETINGRDILVEIKSVNHRYYEFSARVPRAYGYLEEKMKTLLQGDVSRGKIDVGISVYNVDGKDALIEVNKSIAAGYVNALREANAELGLRDDVTLSSIMRLPDMFNVRKNTEDEEVIWADVKIAAKKALNSFLEMRKTEGIKMREDITARLTVIEGFIDEIEHMSPVITEAYRNRMYIRLSEILADNNIDEQRILTEAAIFAEKTAVDEETVRLRSHLNQFKTMLNSPDAVGRKLDFLIQELNREVNTIGSKAQDKDVTKIVVEMKSEIEKIREQIQNVE